jgi:hypothetical protein
MRIDANVTRSTPPMLVMHSTSVWPCVHNQAELVMALRRRPATSLKRVLPRFLDVSGVRHPSRAAGLLAPSPSGSVHH